MSIENNHSSKKPHLVVRFEVFDYQHFNGADPARPRASTKVKGVMTMPDGIRNFCDVWLDGHHHFNVPNWEFGLRIGADYKNRLAVSVIAWQPAQSKG